MGERATDSRTEYRQRMADILNAARRYDGTEKKFHEAIRKLIGFEDWLKEAFPSANDNKRLSEAEEKELAEKMGVRPDRTISGLMDLMHKQMQAALKQDNAQAANDNQPLINLLQDLHMTVVQLAGVLMPPGDVPIVEGTGQKVEKKEVRFEPRLQKLLAFLNQNGIFLDDVIVCNGVITETMMREESYYLVEIPRINKQVLVNQQVGEATFVIDGMLSRTLIMNLTKEELQKQHDVGVTRIVFQNEAQWAAQLYAALNLEAGVGEKMDVGLQEKLRNEVLKQFPTPESWVNLPKHEKKSLKILGLGIIALANRFEIKGNAANNAEYYFELGRKIYGQEHQALGERTNAHLEKMIIQQIPTAEMWATLSFPQKDAFRVAKFGLVALARRFEVQGNPVNNVKYFLELGRKIYGEHHECLKYVGTQEFSSDEIREKILEYFPTPESWVQLTQKQKQNLKETFGMGIGLKAIATKFGIAFNPISFTKYHLELGRKIYGEDHECLKYVEKPELSIDELRKKILEQFPTAEAWSELSFKQRPAARIGGLGLNALATRFGVKGDLLGSTKCYLELGRKIYGEEHECLKVRTVISAEVLQNDILRQFPTAEAWAALKKKQRQNLKILGLGLLAIATRFGVEGDPISNTECYLEIGRKIYGDESF